VKILAGTDCSIMRYVIPGFSLHDELTLYVQAGLSPFEALKTATVNPAVFLNRSHELGTIEKGKLADLVLLDANPLENIMNIRKINTVILNGQLLNHDKLTELLEEAERNAR
jgi:imidazolonepropionase-like amidohydrolase